jgi:outer membrane protein TolC
MKGMVKDMTLRSVLYWVALALLLIATGASVSTGQPDVEQPVPNRPLTLQDCTAIALRMNPQIAASQQQVVVAQAGLTRARSSYYPQLSLSAVEGLSGLASAVLPLRDILSTSSDNTRQDLGLTFGMTLWRQGRKESVEQSKASLQATTFDDTSVAQTLVEQVARYYYGVLATQQLLQVAQAGVDSAQGHREQVKARIALGAAADVDVFPADDDLALAQLDVIDARSNIQLALAQLKNAMGISPETKVELAEYAPAGEETIPDLQQAIRTGLAGRPEVSAGDAAVEAGRYALAQAKIERGPVTDFSVQYGQQYAQWQDINSSWDLLLTVAWPLFDGHAAEANETAAQASLKRSQADLQRLINQVGLDAENALVEVGRARERLSATAKSVAAAEARQAAAEGKYRQGVGILLEVVDARAAVTNARASQVRARYDYQVSLVGLQRALGTLALPETGGR